MDIITTLKSIITIVWGPPLLILLVGTGVYLSIRLRFFQIQFLGYAFASLWRGQKSNHQKGEITSFNALMTSMSATVGTGNIIGAGLAIQLGGPGALFWMWVAALFGMATKFAEAVLAVHFREVNKNKQYRGGPMYYITNGLGPKWKWMALCFSFFGALAAFGIGNTVQSNALADSLFQSFAIPKYITGIALVILVGTVIIGGVKRIAQVAGKLVPFMIVFYLFWAILYLILNAAAIPAAFAQIIKSAFYGHAATGGFVGATLMMAIRFGVARGVFSNEAGLGSASIAHAHAQESDPIKQGSIAMLGVFIDSIIVLTISGLVVITSGLWSSDASGALLTTNAYATTFPVLAKYIVALSLPVFALTTIFGWCLYGERCIEYLLDSRAIYPYRILWLLAVYIGAVTQLDIIWLLADIFNALMVLPNIIAILLLSPLLIKLVKKYR